MRKTETAGGLSVRAIAGTYVVILGIDLDEKKSKGVLGFAIERTDRTENEKYWLEGFKTFEETDPGTPAGTLVSTREHPIQGFYWSDFTAKPEHDYTYRVVALTGKPKNLAEGLSVGVDVTTESEKDGTHAVWFNRGVAGSQAYAREFGNKTPDQVPNGEAYAWLSRGLVEALEAFIGQAKKGYGLRAAVYEFDYQPVLEAFGAAKMAGADVKIIFDAKRNASDDPDKRNRAAIAATGIDALTIPREANPSYIAHNKFIVLLKNNKPVEVWTGSTNITQGGIFGHSNVGHVVRDPAVAATYLAYWNELSGNPEAKALRAFGQRSTPTPPDEPAEGCTPIFSPRPSLDALDWYAARMSAAQSSVFLTAAFGVNDLFMKVLEEHKDYLRYVLLDKGDGNVEIMRRDPDNRVAVGAVVEGAFGRWLKESTVPGFNVHVRFLHTKYMLIDPLSDDPTVITGSANFSNASTTNNDENMVVIRGDTRVADIYVGEFMRLFNHFYFRDFVRDAAASASAHLRPDDTWRAPYYVAGSFKEKERLLFAGTGGTALAAAMPAKASPGRGTKGANGKRPAQPRM
jgi:phosphatidylserine/phosphatidylglycerophosphate/cardiolipin synthase-like enzyme